MFVARLFNRQHVQSDVIKLRSLNAAQSGWSAGIDAVDSSPSK